MHKVEFITKFYRNPKTDGGVERIVSLIPNWFLTQKWARSVFKYSLHPWIRVFKSTAL